MSYALFGCISPLLSVFLKDEKGLTAAHVGVAMAMVSASYLISPALLTLLADTRLQTRQILALSYALTGGVLLALMASGAVPLTMGLMAVYGLSIVAMTPLQDGLYFSAARARQEEGAPVIPYPKVRIWGTLGYMAPALALWWLLRGEDSVAPAFWVACVCAAASVANALIFLPAAAPSARRARTRLPTAEALRVLMGPNTRWLCLGLALATGCGLTYHHFFPIYLRDQIRLGSEWIPLVINLGVLVEVGCTLNYPRLQRWLGDKGIITAGLACMIARMLLLSHFPSLATALLVQLFHGLEITALLVVMPMLLDRLAGDHFRNSMQGAFSMIMGLSRLLGSLLAGRAVEKDMLGALQGAALVGLAAWLVIVLGFRPPRPADETPTRATS